MLADYDMSNQIITFASKDSPKISHENSWINLLKNSTKFSRIKIEYQKKLMRISVDPFTR